jgi:hypothetical protein
MTVECTFHPDSEGGKWEGEVLGYCDVDHLERRTDGPASTVADDLKG